MKQHKKGSAGAVIAIIIIALLIIGVIVLVYFLNKEGYLLNKPNENIKESKIKIVFNAVDSKNPDSIIASKYEIYNYSSIRDEKTLSLTTNIKSGSLSNGETREESINSIPLLFCYSNDYYSARAYPTPHMLTQNFSQDTIFSLTCSMDKIEKNLEISKFGDLDSQISEVTLKIKSNDYYKGLTICPAWTSGFVSVNVRKNFELCETGLWLNHTSFNATTSSYNYLPEGQYICQDRIEFCDSLEGSKCNLKEEAIPNRLKNKVDYCQYTGTHIYAETVDIPLRIETSNYITRNDHIDFYIYDKDLRYNPSLQSLTYESEINGEDIGAKDFTYTINYEGEAIV